jgi:hypothetical protein
MFTLSASAFQALSHPKISFFFPELAFAADGETSLIDVLLYPFKAAAHPRSH